MRGWLRLSLAWDGVLPLTTTIIPFVVWLAFPGNDGAILLTFFYLPMFAAFLRTDIGYDQIKQICGGKAPVLRQCALAIAIMMLFLLDMITSLWIMAPFDTSETILPAVGFYIGYLVFIALALAPSAATRERAAGFQDRRFVPRKDPLEF